jgi:hypothetical protein
MATLVLKRFLGFLLPLFLINLESARAQILQTHDGSFIPDHVLRVTRQTISIGGIQRYTTLVNGTVPGPTLSLAEDKVVWIRVYNDMSGANLTMVSLGI